MMDLFGTDKLHKKMIEDKGEVGDKVEFEEKYQEKDPYGKIHKRSKIVEGKIVGYDKEGNTLIQTSEGVIQRNNYKIKK
jgi:hypothetical protein